MYFFTIIFPSIQKRLNVIFKGKGNLKHKCPFIEEKAYLESVKHAIASSYIGY